MPFYQHYNAYKKKPFRKQQNLGRLAEDAQILKVAPDGLRTRLKNFTL